MPFVVIEQVLAGRRPMFLTTLQKSRPIRWMNQVGPRITSAMKNLCYAAFFAISASLPLRFQSFQD